MICEIGAAVFAAKALMEVYLGPSSVGYGTMQLCYETAAECGAAVQGVEDSIHFLATTLADKSGRVNVSLPMRYPPGLELYRAYMEGVTAADRKLFTAKYYGGPNFRFYDMPGLASCIAKKAGDLPGRPLDPRGNLVAAQPYFHPPGQDLDRKGPGEQYPQRR